MGLQIWPQERLRIDVWGSQADEVTVETTEAHFPRRIVRAD